MPKVKENNPPVKRNNNKKYQMPKTIPEGTIFTDKLKGQWTIGPSIGVGGFGEIYSANAGKSTKSNYVIKVEPHVNGPLFVEINFYIRNARREDVAAFKQSKGLRQLGVPLFVAWGSHSYDGEKYRFLVMERFSRDLNSCLKSCETGFPLKTVYQLAVQMLDVLEYIHSRSYVHADVKASNILLSQSNPGQAYLVDFGLATRFTTQPYKPDPKFAHNGTIEYTSRDAHNGVHTRRGDIEILFYNMIHWAGGKLPWEKKTTDPKVVQSSKEKHMSDVTKFLDAAFGKANVPLEYPKLFELLDGMKHDVEPDYKKVRDLLLVGLKRLQGKLDEKFTFATVRRTPKRKSTTASPGSALASKRKAPAKKPIVVASPDFQDDDEDEARVEPKPAATKRRVKKVIEKISDESESDADNVRPVKVKRPTAKRGKMVGKENGHADAKNDARSESDADDVAVVTKKKVVARRGKKIEIANGQQEANHEPVEIETAAMMQVRQQIAEKKLSKVKKTRAKKC